MRFHRLVSTTSLKHESMREIDVEYLECQNVSAHLPYLTPRQSELYVVKMLDDGFAN